MTQDLHKEKTNKWEKYRFKNWRVTPKYIIFQSIIIITLCAVFYSFSIRKNNKCLSNEIDQNINNVHTIANTIKLGDYNMLSSTLKTLADDEGIKSLFIKNDKNQLYKSILPIYQQLKQNNITNILFTDIQGKIILNMSDKKIENIGDISDETFLQTQENLSFSAGLELGSSEYNIYAFLPYYSEEELIGFLGIEENLGHFSKMIENETDSRVFTVAKKEYLNEDSFSLLRKEQSTRNNWNDLSSYVILSQNYSDFSKNPCFSEENIKQMESGNKLVNKFNIGEKFYTCGGFPIHEKGYQVKGVLIIVDDITELTNSVDRSNNSILLMTLSLILMSAVIAILFAYHVVKSFNKMIKIIASFSIGKYFEKIPITSNDEIGLLSESFNSMADQIKKEAKELKETNINLQNLNNSKNEFISIASHELLTPTSIIEGYCSMIKDEKMLKVKGKTSRYLGDIYKSSKRLAALVKEIITVSSLDRHQAIIKNTAFNISKLIEDIVSSFVADPEIKNRKIKFSSEAKNIVVFADFGKTKEIVNKLISNALKYSVKGDIVIKCNVLEKDNINLAEISVADQGIGIPEEEKKYIFQKFFRTSNGIEMCDGGSGLGLHIAQAYARLMKGHITFKSEVNKGTVFYFYLRLANPEEIKKNNI